MPWKADHAVHADHMPRKMHRCYLFLPMICTMLRKRSSSSRRACKLKVKTRLHLSNFYLKTFLEVTCTKAVRPGVTDVMESGRTNFILPAELVDIRLFVEVVTILTDVVQLQVKHIFVGSCQLDPNLEFVKSFTPVRFQNFSILPDKNA